MYGSVSWILVQPHALSSSVAAPAHLPPRKEHDRLDGAELAQRPQAIHVVAEVPVGRGVTQGSLGWCVRPAASRKCPAANQSCPRLPARASRSRNRPIEPREAVQRPQLREIDDDGDVGVRGVRGPDAVVVDLGCVRLGGQGVRLGAAWQLRRTTTLALVLYARSSIIAADALTSKNSATSVMTVHASRRNTYWNTPTDVFVRNS